MKPNKNKEMIMIGLIILLVILAGYIIDDKIIKPKMNERAIREVAEYQSNTNKVIFFNGTDIIEDNIINICERIYGLPN